MSNFALFKIKMSNFFLIFTLCLPLSFLAKPVDKHGITPVHHLSALDMQSRYRYDEDGSGPRILESQPKDAQDSKDAQRVDDELSASFDDSTNVRSKDFISRDF